MIEQIDGYWLPDDVRVCNCARCRRLLAAHGQEDVPSFVLMPPVVADRVQGRPLCAKCVEAISNSHTTGERT